MDSTERQIELLKSELEYHKKMLQWYRDTYETRSLLGVVKDKFSKGVKAKVKKVKTIQSAKAFKKNVQGFGISDRNLIDESSFYSDHAMDNKLLKVVVVVHLFYLDLWEEINDYLKKIGINFDLLVTINEGDVSAKTTDKIKTSYPKAIILKVPNKGLDIGPFFESVNFLISKNLKYDYILKIHTKKSLGVDANIGESWRKKSYESLMGSYSIVSHILRLFRTNPTVGMIGPFESRTKLTMNDVNNGGSLNLDNMKLLAQRLSIKDLELDFFGGTMFWARWPILEKKFRKKTLTINDFESGYKKDGLLSHAMERLLACIVRDEGYDLLELNKINDYLFYKNRRKKICWVHPGFGIGGGNRIIFDICQEQLKFFEVYSISFNGPPFNGWMDLKHNVITFSNMEEARQFVNTVQIDYVFATGWQTVDFVRSLPDHCKKFYFIQDYEPWFADANANLAKETYKNSFNANIVYADWLKQKLLLDHDLKSTFVKNGIANYPTDDRTNTFANPIKLLLYYKLKNHLGRGADLIEVLLKKLAKHNELEINVIGHEDPNVSGVNYLGELHKKDLEDLYRKSNIFIDLSRHRGVATISMEVAQFGVVSLLSKSEYGIHEYGFEDERNCLFVTDIDDAYKKTLQLSTDESKYNLLQKNVLELSKTFKYQYTVNDFNQIIEIL